MRRAFALLLVVGALAAVPACGSDPEADETGAPAYRYEPEADEGQDPEAIAQEEWDSQQGVAWEEFNEGYSAGWEAGCDIAFEGSPDGYLYDQGVEYSMEDCSDLAPYDASDALDMPFDVPADPYYEGEALGETHGCVAAFEQLTTYGVLNWGEDSYDESVCP